jgi:hypothetical protein
MGLLDLINHFVNFIAPACVVGTLLAWLAPWIRADFAVVHGRLWQGLINCVVGMVASAGGLWFFGHDGKMATYGAMVLAVATTQWLGSRGWK